MSVEKKHFTANACTIHVPGETSTSNINVVMSSSPLNIPCTDTLLCKNASRTSVSGPHCRKSTDKVTLDVVPSPHTSSFYPYLSPPIHNLIPVPLSPQYTAHTICPSLQPKCHHHDMRTGCFHSLIEQHLLLCLNHLIHVLNKHRSCILLTPNLSFNHSTLEWLCHTPLSLGILILMRNDQLQVSLTTTTHPHLQVQELKISQV